jgi:hypothetical protein
MLLRSVVASAICRQAIVLKISNNRNSSSISLHLLENSKTIIFTAAVPYQVTDQDVLRQL